jgi:hypothetical protein
MTPTALAQSTARASSDADAPSSAFEEWLVGDLLARGDARVVVVSPLKLDPIHLDPDGRVTTLCCSARGVGANFDVDRGFDSGSFDAVYLHRVIAIAMPGRCLGAARHLLKTGGYLVAAVDPAEFSFAPLPAGGDAQLLGRILTDAGFCRVELIHRAPSLIIVAAHRDERDRTR